MASKLRSFVRSTRSGTRYHSADAEQQTSWVRPRSVHVVNWGLVSGCSEDGEAIANVDAIATNDARVPRLERCDARVVKPRDRRERIAPPDAMDDALRL